MNRIQFEAIGGDWIDPPLLMPAAIPLELSGENIRNRLITSSDVSGDELALRPDLTLAVVRHFIESGDEAPVSYRYFGRAFRQPVLEGEPIEFDQTGFEILGDQDLLDANIRTLGTICEEVAAAGIRDAQLYVGDVSIFSHVVRALGLSRAWQLRLSRAFRRREGVRSLLSTSAGNEQHSQLAETLSGLPADKAAALLDEVMSFSSSGVFGGRSPDEILERLRARADALSEQQLPDEAAAVLSQLIDIKGPPSVFLAQLRDLGSDASLDLSDIIERTEAFFSGLEQRRIPFWQQAHVSIQFGRRFDYYDGLVFELCHTGLSSQRPLAAGGRYDGLVSWLSGHENTVSAVGGVVRPDRIERALQLETETNA
tara:strand:+ start:2803 stop:3912 length:1110 start_codon:yes stop_codon:yes gene_type:complete